MRFSTAFLAAASAATVIAQTAPGFNITVEDFLPVVYSQSNTNITPPGLLVDRSAVLSAPNISLPDGASETVLYLLFMVDQDVFSNGTRTTILHWFQPNLQVQGSNLVFNAVAQGASTAVGAEYRPPTPPAGSGDHAYSFVLYVQPSAFAVPQSYLSINPPDPTNNAARRGFNLTNFANEAGLMQPIAGNYLRVLNGTSEESSSAVTETFSGVTTTPTDAMSSSVMATTTGSDASMTMGSMTGSATASATGATGATGAANLEKGGRATEFVVALVLGVVGAGLWML